MQFGIDTDISKIEYLLGSLTSTVQHIEDSIADIRASITSIQSSQGEMQSNIKMAQTLAMQPKKMFDYWVDFCSKMWPIIIPFAVGAIWVTDRLRSIPNADQMHDILRVVQHVAS